MTSKSSPRAEKHRVAGRSKPFSGLMSLMMIIVITAGACNGSTDPNSSVDSSTYSSPPSQDFISSSTKDRDIAELPETPESAATNYDSSEVTRIMATFSKKYPGAQSVSPDMVVKQMRETREAMEKAQIFPAKCKTAVVLGIHAIEHESSHIATSFVADSRGVLSLQIWQTSSDDRAVKLVKAMNKQILGCENFDIKMPEFTIKNSVRLTETEVANVGSASYLRSVAIDPEETVYTGRLLVHKGNLVIAATTMRNYGEDSLGDLKKVFEVLELKK